MNTRCYFENAELHRIPAVFSSECIERSQILKEQYGEQETHQVIYETVLTEPEATCDISFRVDTGKKPVGNYWLEFDYAVYSSGDETALTPCKFLDASCLKPNRDQEEVRLFLKQDLTELVGQDKAALLAPSLLDVADKLDEKCSALFQVGSMDSRAASDSVRIYTQQMKPRNVLSLLSSLSWTGDPQPAQRVMEYWEKSPFLAELRRVEDKRREPCLGCLYENYCLPCNAVGYKLQRELDLSDELSEDENPAALANENDVR